MRIAVMAAGAVGGYFGARMAAAGHDVHFIARGAHLDAIRKNGLTIESPLGNLNVKDAKATDDPAKVGAVDIVLFAVKLWDTEKASEQAKPLIGPGTRVITLQNGIDSVERMAPILGDEHVVGGIAHISSVISAPGVISQNGQFANMHFGRIDGKPDAKLTAFADAAKAASVEIRISDSINRDRWQKFIFLVALSGMTAATRSTVGPIMADPETRAFLRALMAETFAVGRAKGVALPDGFVEERMKFSENLPKTIKASMAGDLERGNRLELDWLAGKVRELGRALNVPTPASDTVYTVLKLHRMGTPR